MPQSARRSVKLSLRCEKDASQISRIWAYGQTNKRIRFLRTISFFWIPISPYLAYCFLSLSFPFPFLASPPQNQVNQHYVNVNFSMPLPYAFALASFHRDILRDSDNPQTSHGAQTLAGIRTPLSFRDWKQSEWTPKDTASLMLNNRNWISKEEERLFQCIVKNRHRQFLFFFNWVFGRVWLD